MINRIYCIRDRVKPKAFLKKKRGRLPFERITKCNENEISAPLLSEKNNGQGLKFTLCEI